MLNAITLLKRLKTIRAVIFDMDGVIVDSEKQHFLAHQEALSMFGVKINEEFYIAHGVCRDPARFYTEAFNQSKLPQEFVSKILGIKKKIYKKIQDEQGIIPIQPAITLIKTLYEKKVPLAIASSVHKTEVNNILQHLKIAGCFTIIVGSSGLQIRNKPCPDIYIKTAELLGLHPINCIAIEDSGNGAISANMAGMTCIVVPNEYTKTHKFNESYVFDSLLDLKEIFDKITYEK